MSSPGSPSRTVTFLFTDIEGSTKLWDSQPDQMRVALARHDGILREQIKKHNGEVFKTIGDAFCAAFENPVDALVASTACQIALKQEAWPTDRPIKVRMALHTGTAEARDNDYFGPPLNRVARLLSAGHGGQVLVSQATTELAQDFLPPAITFLPLGEHRLKDLGRPETVFQILHDDLDSSFAEIRSLENSSLKHNLPLQTTSFIGREKEIADAKNFLQQSRLLTLTGSGGSGKTRLGLQIVADEIENYPDGVWFVELAAVSDPDLVPSIVAGALGLVETAGTSIKDSLLAFLADKQLLLLLDNCEHLLQGCAFFADSVLKRCPKVKIVATSREGLGVPGERTYRVPSLSLPKPKAKTSPEELTNFEAVQLFVQRADLYRPGFAVNVQNAPSLASVCHRLDGIPLAIELAAARMRSLTIEEIDQRLDQRFRLLTSGSRTALPRQQTLRSLIDWSYDLLNPNEKAILCRVSLFSGTFTLEAAETVCSDDSVEDWEVADLVISLVDKSLIIVESEHGHSHYRLLESVRQYAHDRLLEDGPDDRWRQKHLAFFTDLAEQAEVGLRGPDQPVWLERMDDDHDNIRSAMAWGLEHSTDDLVPRLATACFRYWETRGFFTEGRRWSELALSHPSVKEPNAVRGKVLNSAGIFAHEQGDSSVAQRHHEEALAIRTELGLTEAMSSSLINLGNIAYNAGDFQTAKQRYLEGAKYARDIGNDWMLAIRLNNLGSVAIELEEYEDAEQYLTDSLMLRQRLGVQTHIALSLDNLGLLALVRGQFEKADKHMKEGLTVRRDVGDRLGMVASLESYARLAAESGNPELALIVHCTADRVRTEMNCPIAPSESVQYDLSLARARDQLGSPENVEGALEIGRQNSLEKTVDLVLSTPFGARPDLDANGPLVN